MELDHNETLLSWRATWLAQAHAHPYTSVGLVLAVAIVVGLVLAVAIVAGLLLASVWRASQGEAEAALRLGLLGGMAG